MPDTPVPAPPPRPGFAEIAPFQLMRLIGTPDAPVVVDVRTAADFAEDPRIVPTTICCSHDTLRARIPDLTGRTVAVICHKGLKLSHGAAAILRSAGIKAQAVTGGMVAWRDAGLPMIPTAALPLSGIWVTRQRPKIDRIACPWLIRRFVDPAATFLFVPPSEVAAVAERFDGTPFDIPNVPFTHQSDRCTFDAMITTFGLGHDALDRLAHVVRAADTNRHDLAPEAAGLLALSVGLSRMYRDDVAQLEAGIGLYDALYRWARDGQNEGHDWPGGLTV